MAVGKNGYLDVTVMPSSVGKVRVYWREDYDPAENCSTLTVTDIRGYLWHRTAWAYVSLSLTAGGVTVLPDTDGSWMFSANADTTLRSVVSASDWEQSFVPVTSAPIYHNDDGTKSLTLTATLHDVTAPAVGFDGTNNQTASRVITLTEIPRASGVSASAGTIGSPLTVSVSRANSAFTHTLTYAFGGAAGIIAEQTADVAVVWTPPMELCGEIPNADSAVCTITCSTYSGDALIGTKTADVMLTVPDFVGLTLSEGWAVAAPYNDGTAAQGMDIYVQGCSAARVTFDETKIDKTAAYGSEIAAFSVRCGDRTDTDTYRTGLLTAAGDTDILCTVTDTRGRAVSEVLTVSVLPYAKPTLSDIVCFRCDSDGTANEGGAALCVTAVCGISPLAGHNRGTLQAAYRTMNGSCGEAVTLESGRAAVLWAGDLSPRQTYELALTAEDVLGNRAVYTVIVPTDEVFFHGRQGGRGAAFGKYAEEDDLLEVDWNLKVKQALAVEGAAEIGGDVTAGGRLTAQSAEISGGLNVSGALHLSGALTVEDAESARDNLGITLDALGGVPVTRTVNGKALSEDIADGDYVTAQGTSGIWTYRKWNSGIGECWGRTPNKTVSCTTGWGGVYGGSNIADAHAYPFPFTALPVVSAAPAFASYNWFLHTNSAGSTTVSPVWNATRGTSGSVTGGVWMYVVGRWK